MVNAPTHAVVSYAPFETCKYVTDILIESTKKERSEIDFSSSSRYPVYKPDGKTISLNAKEYYQFCSMQIAVLRKFKPRYPQKLADKILEKSLGR